MVTIGYFIVIKFQCVICMRILNLSYKNTKAYGGPRIVYSGSGRPYYGQIRICKGPDNVPNKAYNVLSRTYNGLYSDLGDQIRTYNGPSKVDEATRYVEDHTVELADSTKCALFCTNPNGPTVACHRPIFANTAYYGPTVTHNVQV